MYEPGIIYANIPEPRKRGENKFLKNQQKCVITSKKCNVSSFLIMITLNSLDAVLFFKSVKLVL